MNINLRVVAFPSIQAPPSSPTRHFLGPRTLRLDKKKHEISIKSLCKPLSSYQSVSTQANECLSELMILYIPPPEGCGAVSSETPKLSRQSWCFFESPLPFHLSDSLSSRTMISKQREKLMLRLDQHASETSTNSIVIVLTTFISHMTWI